MAKVFNQQNIEYEVRKGKLSDYTWSSSSNIMDLIQSKNLKFDVRILHPDKYSYPYHSHRHAEELFVILEGKSLLRTPEGITEVKEGDIIFFEMGDSGAHQLYNNTDKDCRYLDIRTYLGMDVCDYPDSGKVNILPAMELYEKGTRVDYFTGEDNVREKWAKE